MNLSYRQLEDVIMHLHSVAPAKRSALQGRIKHFQRNGWPGGTNTGKGRPAAYGFGPILKLALGFELLELGVTPERAVYILQRNWTDVRTAVSLAFSSNILFSENTKKPSFDVYLYCDPQALSSMTEAVDDLSEDTFFYTSAPELSRNLMEEFGVHVRRLALINLTQLFLSLAEGLQMRADEFRKSWEEWEASEWNADREAYRSEFGVYPEDHEPNGKTDPHLPPQVRRN